MSSVVVVGTQWGDEGKGKITDFLSKKADIIARFAGGDNAGHTIKFGGETYKLHLIPSGIFYQDKISVMGNGLVINPKSLVNLTRPFIAPLEEIVSERSTKKISKITPKNIIMP